MASQSGTKADPPGILAFLDGVEPPARQAEARRLVTIFQEVTGLAPQVHPGGIVGFGRYDYRYDSGHSGTSLATGFAPRKAELSLYINAGCPAGQPLLARLGKHRMGKGCLYLKRLEDADEAVLRALIAAGLADLQSRWTVTPT